MRCSSCEPLLDGYLEGTLSRRESAGVASHLHACPQCADLLRELRVIDALLTTARTPSVGDGFTASVVSATHATPLGRARRVPFGIALLLYVAIAWTFAAVALRSRSLAPLAGSGGWVLRRDATALAAALHAFAPATPILAAVVTAVLLVDLFLLLAIFYAHRKVRPLIVMHLARGRRP